MNRHFEPDFFSQRAVRYIRFWAHRNNIDLQNSSFEVIAKRIVVPNEWEKGILTQNLASPWLPIGKIGWDNGHLYSDILQIDLLDQAKPTEPFTGQFNVKKQFVKIKTRHITPEIVRIHGWTVDRSALPYRILLLSKKNAYITGRISKWKPENDKIRHRFDFLIDTSKFEDVYDIYLCKDTAPLKCVKTENMLNSGHESLK